MGFIDNEIVGPNPGIDDFTSVPFPCYNVRVSNAHRRGVCRFNPSVKPRSRNGLLRNVLYRSYLLGLHDNCAFDRL